jgi:hypothetical protein
MHWVTKASLSKMVTYFPLPPGEVEESACADRAYIENSTPSPRGCVTPSDAMPLLDNPI